MRNFGINLRYQDSLVAEGVKMKIVNFVTTGAPKVVIDADRHYIPNVYGKPRDIERYVEIQHPKAK